MKKDFDRALADVGNINEVEIAVLTLLGNTRNHKGQTKVFCILEKSRRMWPHNRYLYDAAMGKVRRGYV
ncbi:hypothetical protein A3D80_04150 [Candidatus Roizmanbacteria bacterium RIFCSPHIGHO2_02_FULL_40_13b]|uniref:Uncharacterized protein n=1 Tax=Candidatus Roizmanbacteria bacterium RIFCSPHIGHO2_01_FULL_39_24 TaxID=1802032 RepID=A0A1F7GKU3_9BACT|nr:MAG: hypothetical protein A2799_00275 [Candidatus Roizmanbacteria bacterium RIFCSPHIGHO2_01_FULL_39_24]OGK27985.1 MAG: hypothetical protein A3D80_04150 [Candidatus Roizmanbacteria bacterium RIFCSPHIGHO2_02_FULL_40_13b]OGK49223.1 MAG: hypothetical protein A3A56_04485 [Candidatus Roizmanbacteria bacterium RIFCSPLOWO2_01_FULL_40_32]OGK57194.1 MAG: hypothetical protein A3H83_03005 [Candidatus Roizmanbacteria bacterium RIFCSPLOWO2_02_FULL_39_8]